MDICNMNQFLFLSDEILPIWYEGEETITSIMCKGEELIYFEGNLYITRFKKDIMLHHVELNYGGAFFLFAGDSHVSSYLSKERIFISTFYRSKAHMRFVKFITHEKADIEFSLKEYERFFRQISLLKDLFYIHQRLSEQELIMELEKIFSN